MKTKRGGEYRYANVPLLQKPVEPDALEQILLSLLDAPVLATAQGG